MLSPKIEDAVNAAVRAKTPDPVLFIAELGANTMLALLIAAPKACAAEKES
ncbi:hypothetical protein COCNU_04G000820 [Cocos nucifera]|uniref:Uncharacterized protein n=1 Tax=Cocos nucifera TaxID=13894 RepID=A0A8K0MZM2_COCNU|nr:hypothetical protein COCNU_04G000820 [Cocos nucifera]